MAVPIRDLEVGEQALSCTLSFSRRPHFCYVPWKAVFALVNEQGRGMVWPDDVPPELVAQAQKQHEVARRRASLRTVGSEDSGRRHAAPKAARVSESPKNAAGSTESSRPVQVKPASAEEASTKASPSEPAAAPSPSDRQGDPKTESETPSKRDRSLPPYLRIVK
jgi:stringent starvation protein B